MPDLVSIIIYINAVSLKLAAYLDKLFNDLGFDMPQRATTFLPVHSSSIKSSYLAALPLKAQMICLRK